MCQLAAAHGAVARGADQLRGTECTLDVSGVHLSRFRTRLPGMETRALGEYGPGDPELNEDTGCGAGDR